jgi:hypothetical protein
MGAQEFLESAIKALRNESLNTDNLQLIGLAVNQLRILKAQKSNPLIFRGEKRIQSSTAYASYYAASDTIVIRPGLSYSFKDAVEAIIHEVVHANTASLVLANFYAEGMHGEIGISDVAKEFASKYGSKLKDFNNELFLLTTQANREFLRMLASKDTFDGRTLTSQELEILTKQPITIKQNGIDIPYGFKDQFELLAEFFSNPKFRELTKLIQLPFEKQTFKEANSKPQVISLFGRIISTITKFFQSITKKVKYYDHTIVTSSTTLYDVLETLLERGAFDNLGIDLSKRTVSVEEGVKWFKGASEGGVPLTPQQMFAIAVEHYGLKPSDTSSGIDFNVEELIKNVVNFDHTIHNTDAKIKALKERAENYEVDPTDASKYQEKKVPSNKFMRVSDDEKGWIAQFKRRPKQVQTIEERAANMWGSDAPTTTKFTRHGWIAQDAWIEKEKEIEARGKNRGRLIHGLIELYANGDSTGTIRTRIDELMNLTGYEEKDFAWVKDKLKYIFSRAGINSLDNVKDEHKDRVVGEVTVANEILGLAGTIDMLIFHSDGTVSIKDIKAGYNFLNSSEIETMLFGEQPVANDLIWDTWKNHAQLQVMTYALLYKLQNPEAKFNSLDILWMPDADAIFDDTFRNKINPEVFLNMIKSLLERKMPDKLKALKESMSEEAFNKLWDPTEYKAGYQKSIRDEHTRMEVQPVDQQIKAKIQKVRTIILEDLNPHNYRKATIDSKKKTELVSKLMREILELQKTATDLDISTVTEDIGKFQNWLFTSSTVSNPYIQTWDQLFMAKRDNFNKEVEHSRNKFLSLLEPIKKEYLKRNPGKGTLDAITKGGLNFIDSRKLFEFAYVPVKDEGGVIIDYRLRFSDKDFQELVDDNINFGYINASNVHIYKNFLDFVNDTYEGFFVNKDGKTALANRVATYVNFKGFDKPITNLELYNGKRVKLDKKNSDRDKELFEYKRGFMPKVPPLLSEFGLLSKDERLPGTPEKSDSRKNWRRIWFQRNLTFAEEHIFEGFDKKAMAEGLPMKYLNNRKDFASNPDFFTLNLEHQFDRFTRAYMWKEQMDDVFAYGQGLRIMFNAQEDAPERLIAFMQRELDLKLRGRPSDHGASEKFLSKNKYNVSVVKVLSKIKFAFNYPLLALNYLGGSANAIFTTLLTLKHGIQNTTFRNKSMSGLNGDEWDFGVKHLAQAYPEVMKIMKAGMVDGNIRNSKVYQLAKKFGYLPSSFDWSTAPHNLTTSGNRVFNTNLLFMFYSMPEEFIAMLVMTAQLMSMKVTHGNLTGTSLYDMYELVDVKDANGNTYKDIKWKDDATTNKPYVRAYKNVSADPNNPELAELTELDELEVRRLYSAYDKMHGGYRSTDKIYLDYNIFGQLALQFKRYLPHILRQGMTSAAERSNLGFYEVKTLEDGKPTVEWVSKVMEGRWPIVGKVLARGLVNLMDIDNVPVDAEGFRGWVKRNLGDLEGYDLSKLDRGQREAFRDAWVTMLIMFMGLGASFMAGGDGDDDDPVNRYVSRIFNDLTQMYNISELGKNLVNWNPISLKKLHDFQRDSLQVMFSIMFWGIGNEERAFTPDGRLEGMNALMKDLPVTSIIRKTEDLGTSDIFDD